MGKAATTVVQDTAIASDTLDLNAIRSNPDDAMTRIYRDHRAAFIPWAKSWTKMQDQDLVDLFQDSVIVFLSNIRSGKLTVLTASVRTYLFGIGKNLINARLRSANRITFPGEDQFQFPDEFDLGMEHEAIQIEEEMFLQKALSQLAEHCQQLLRLTFFEGLKSAAIAKKMGYASEEVVRSQRKRCLDKLRSMFKNE